MRRHVAIMLYGEGLGLPPAIFDEPLRIAAAVVPRWDPEILCSERVAPSELLEILRYRAPSKYTAPEIRFSAPQPLFVRGGSFTVLAERVGVIPESTYLFGDYAWKDLFSSVAVVETAPDRALLVAANAAWNNYYHWLLQCVGAVLVGQAHLGRDFAVVVPPLGPAWRETLRLAGIDDTRVRELPATAALAADRGVYSNLSSGAFAFLPHPALVAAFDMMAGRPPRSRYAGRKVFVSRADAHKRQMVNEPALAEALEATGFETVQCGALSPSEQIALFRDAALVVAPHGAALTNLLFARPGSDGPIVVELHQENYIHQAYLKLCQVKRLRYAGLVNPIVDPGADGRHDSTWEADIPAILGLLSRL